MSVLRALARIGDKRAVPRIAEAAETDPALAVSARATDVLAELGESRAMAQFVSLLIRPRGPSRSTSL
jgi:HEAT repeat protein